MAIDRFTKIGTAERVLLAVGLTLLGAWGAARLHRSVASRAALKTFKASAWVKADAESAVDFTLWSPQRIAAYKESLTAKRDLPLAILRIPKINLEVPVFEDTDELTLNRGVGRILGTAQIGEPGNVGIAGHRDGFFRGLKDVQRDDFVDLIRPGRTERYVISNIQIVNPDDIYVLDPTAVPTLTLVTCYPFYYVGSAPQRYVVTATIQISSQADVRVDVNSSSTGKKINEKEKER